MTLLEVTQKIIAEHKYIINPIRSILGIKKGTCIKLLDKAEPELFSELYNAICDRLGIPLYVHSYYGYIWESNGECLAYNCLIEGCDYWVINFFIFRHLPCGKKLTYPEYTQFVDTINQIFTSNNLTFIGYIHYHNNMFSFEAENKEEKCDLYIGKKLLIFHRLQKETMESNIISVKHRYTRQNKPSTIDLTNITREVENCFVAK